MDLCTQARYGLFTRYPLGATRCDVRLTAINFLGPGELPIGVDAAAIETGEQTIEQF